MSRAELGNWTTGDRHGEGFAGLDPTEHLADLITQLFLGDMAHGADGSRTATQRFRQIADVKTGTSLKGPATPRHGRNQLATACWVQILDAPINLEFSGGEGLVAPGLGDSTGHRAIQSQLRLYPALRRP